MPRVSSKTICHCNYSPCQCPTDEEIAVLVGKPKVDWVVANICTYHCVKNCNCYYWREEQRRFYEWNNRDKREGRPDRG
jgi:beta-xylosidase